MLTIVGLLVVVVAVLGGFTIAGGSVPVLFHVSEFVVIGGTAIGTVLISTPGPVLKAVLVKLKLLLRKDPFDKSLYLDTTNENGPKLVDCDALLDGSPIDE